MAVIHDISPMVSSRTAVFPGDTPFGRKVSLDFKEGHHLGLSSIHSTVHIGAHTDAPSHYHPDGESIEKRPLELYVGPCQVITVGLSPGQRIFPQHLRGIAIQAPRVLFRTDSFPDPNHWNGDFNSLSPELVNWLAQQNVRLVGIDTPSIDPAESKKLESHQAVYENNMAILEGILLGSVQDGIYDLIALPLRLENADASPVRAVLIETTHKSP